MMQQRRFTFDYATPGTSRLRPRASGPADTRGAACFLKLLLCLATAAAVGSIISVGLAELIDLLVRW